MRLYLKFDLSKKKDVRQEYDEDFVPVTLFPTIMRNMRLRKKIKSQQCAMREPTVPFVKCAEGTAIHPFIIRELVTPFQSPPSARYLHLHFPALYSLSCHALTPLSRRS